MSLYVLSAPLWAVQDLQLPKTFKNACLHSASFIRSYATPPWPARLALAAFVVNTFYPYTFVSILCKLPDDR
ncbi:hypothetical protein B0H16DRAFT_1725173 [Mycena metata]|uniref:Uncharacterized protein n=1 Tax=Mycena metata TaxID=1033252 RepID=A0AAD7IUU0_9AGAR|nr:hypothetical protein B0H16DRAFT_1725173 [Mycena metata]